MVWIKLIIMNTNYITKNALSQNKTKNDYDDLIIHNIMPNFITLEYVLCDAAAAAVEEMR